MVTKMPKYEYKIMPLPKFINDAENSMNRLAEDMWELVTIFNHPNPKEFKFEPSQQTQTSLFAIYRRQLS